MGIILKEIRKRYNLTQAELAEKVGVSRSAIAQIESFKNSISLDLAKRISETFNISINNILDIDSREETFEVYNDSPNNIWDSYYGELTMIEQELDRIEILKLLITKVSEDKKLKGITPSFDKFSKKYDFEKAKKEFEEIKEKEINQKRIDNMQKLIDLGVKSLYNDLYNNLSVAYNVLAEYYKS